MTSDDAKDSDCMLLQISRQGSHNTMWMSLPDASSSPSQIFSGTSEWSRFRIEMNLHANGGQGLGTIKHMILTSDTTWQMSSALTNFSLMLDSTRSDCMNPAKWNGFSGRLVSENGGVDNIRLEWMTAATSTSTSTT